MSKKRAGGLPLLILLAGLVGLAGCDTGDGPGGDPDSVGPNPYQDSDGDGISDQAEGRWDGLGAADTDGDTIPDWEDDDSDGDTIPDITEAGDLDITTDPEDADADGIPDFRDPDSDDNGILDSVEGTADPDGDGIGSYADLDNDGDGMDDVTEIQGNPTMPPDTDSDGTADYNDLDSDNDVISDQHEQDPDSDEDLIPDYLDLDSDGDTIPDIDEAGDTDVATAPHDTDGDGAPDYLDLDSDADGLPDMWENENGTDPYEEDTDLDGVSDMIEVGAGTDPLDAGENPRTEGNFVFIVEYNDPADPPDPPIDPDPTNDHLVFATDLQMADVFFTLDSSGSMNGEISNLLTSLRSVIMPQVRAEIPNVWFGVGRFEDCDYCAYDMAVMQEMTSVDADVETALTGWDTCGGSEPYLQNLVALATGDVTPYSSWTVTPTSWTCGPEGDIGWACFRTDSLPIIIQFGDEDFGESMTSCSPGSDHDQAIMALNDISAKYIGVNSGSGTYGSRADMVVVANGTGSVDTAGNPLVFDIDSSGSGLGDQVVDAIEILANQVPITVTTNLRDDPTDLVDTVSEFIDYIEPSVVGGYADPGDPSIICESGLAVADMNAPFDGRPDTFTAVLPGTPVCFDIYVQQNWTVPATLEPQTFLCQIDVIGDGITVLSTRDVYFLVPPTIPDIILE